MHTTFNYKISGNINYMVDKAVAIANDNTHGYDQANRGGNPDFDCSSLIAYCMKEAGFNVPTLFTTHNAREYLVKAGFTIIPYTADFTLLRGDIIVNTDHHMIMMVSNTNCVTATINEKGTTTGGEPGDQTGREIYIRSFYVPSYDWDYIARYTHAGVFTAEQVFSYLPLLRYGSQGNDVRIIQACLSYHCKLWGLEIDGIFGAETQKAVIDFQKKMGLTPDGIVGPITYCNLFNVTD